MTALWECDHCGGPAVWTFIGGEPFYHCEEQCDGFRQLELFEEEGVCSSVRSDAAARMGPLEEEGDNELPF